jgi:hypothetical protein
VRYVPLFELIGIGVEEDEEEEGGEEEDEEKEEEGVVDEGGSWTLVSDGTEPGGNNPIPYEYSNEARIEENERE